MRTTTRPLADREDGRVRPVIENVQPCVDCGRFPAKRTLNEPLIVSADVFTDSHDEIGVELIWRHTADEQWRRVAMAPVGNDRWEAALELDRLGLWEYRIRSWIDDHGSWASGLEKKHAAGIDVSVELLGGAQFARRAAGNADERFRAELERLASALSSDQTGRERQMELALSDRFRQLLHRYDPPARVAWSGSYQVAVDPVLARFSAWYELFPRSASPDPDRHGTFADVEDRLDYIADLGFDIVYLPPIHPIGEDNRKGPNNALEARPGDPGSPWAIGSRLGGHKAIHPELGTDDDFRRLVAAAENRGLKVALDIAFQCAPDHPWVSEHPEWFRRRPDGTIQYAENPPKKYQDIYPLDFESEDWRGLWQELKSVFEHWIERGVTVFRVDNPHTKSFPFWEWCISELRRDHPELVLLSESFTRPRRLYRLAKLGFNQSYTYFAWKNSRAELEEYFTELASADIIEYTRANVWPNTPDILTDFIQHGGRPASVLRLILATTLAASYGIYGPPYELGYTTAVRQGSEEYLDSEKYQQRTWDLEAAHSLAPIIRRLNSIRRQHPALQTDRGLRFHRTGNDQLICYSKQSGSDLILCVVTLDPHQSQDGMVHLDLPALGLDWHQRCRMHDLLSGAHHDWQGPDNYVRLDPEQMPAHVFKVEVLP